MRRTVRGATSLEGPGLFAPLHSRVTIRPAPPGTGLLFHRLDLPDLPPIPARVGHVATAPRKTVLVARPGDVAGGGMGIHTVEHLISALAGLGITDALVDVHGAELPMMDGSALPFARALLGVGVVEVPAGPHPLAPLLVTRSLRLQRDSAWIQADPHEQGDAGPWLDLHYRLDYGPGAPIPPQSGSFRLDYARPDTQAYLRDVAPARTFTTVEEALAMRRAGLFSHLSPGDTLVIGPDGPVGGPYRLPGEPARHKLLDLIGDLALAGRPILGRISASQSGHALNHEMAGALLAAF